MELESRPVVIGIDDCRTVHARLTALLSPRAAYLGFESWPAAMRRLIAERPALILVDLDMEGLQGEEVVQLLLRSRRLFGDPAILVFSTHSPEAIAERIDGLDVEILPKTFDAAMVAALTDALATARRDAPKTETRGHGRPAEGAP